PFVYGGGGDVAVQLEGRRGVDARRDAIFQLFQPRPARRRRLLALRRPFAVTSGPMIGSRSDQLGAKHSACSQSRNDLLGYETTSLSARRPSAGGGCWAGEEIGRASCRERVGVRGV